MRWRIAHDDGFTLIEVLIALLVFATTTAVIAGLSSVAIQSRWLAAEQTIETIAAAQKLEELIAGLDASAAPVSMAGALDRDVAGYADRLDPSGRPVAGLPSTGTYLRRWMVAAPAVGPGTLVLLRVVVAPAQGAASAIDVGRLLWRSPRRVVLDTLWSPR